MSTNMYSAKRENHAINIKNSFYKLYKAQMFVDITIFCNNLTIKMHKTILVISSSYFREILAQENSIDKIIINGMKDAVLKALIDYLYLGVVTISELLFNELVTAAKYFGIDGLQNININKLPTEYNSSTNIDFNKNPPIFFAKNRKVLLCIEGQAIENSTITDKVNLALAKEEEVSRRVLEMIQKYTTNNEPLTAFECDETDTNTHHAYNANTSFENPEIKQEVIEGTDEDQHNQTIISIPYHREVILTHQENKQPNQNKPAKQCITFKCRQTNVLPRTSRKDYLIQNRKRTRTISIKGIASSDSE